MSRALSEPVVSCVFVCHDGTGRVLLARRAAGARDEPGTWDSGAGALEHGETFVAADPPEPAHSQLAPTLGLFTGSGGNGPRRGPG